MTRHVTLTAAALTLLISTVAARSQQGLPPSPAGGASQPQSPTAAPTGTGTQDPAGGRGGLGRGRSMSEPDFSKKPPVTPLPPEEEVKKIWLPPGFKLELVLSEPDIQEPAQIAFDGNGRMFVLELRGYMQTADADGELEPVGRISVHEDKDGDGK